MTSYNLVLFLLLLLFNSCIGNDKTVLEGTFENFNKSSDSLEVHYMQDFLVKKIEKIKMDEEGQFNLVIDCNYPTRVRISNKSLYFEFYISPKSKIKIEADLTSQSSLVETIKFSGDHASLNEAFFEVSERSELSKLKWRSGEDLPLLALINKINRYYRLKRVLLNNEKRIRGITSSREEAVFRLDSIADEYKKASVFLALIESKKPQSKNAADFFKTHIRKDILAKPDRRMLEINNVGSFWSHAYLSYLIRRDADTIPDFFKRYGYYLTALKKIDSLYTNPLKDYAKAAVIYDLLQDARDYRPGKDSLIRLSRKFLLTSDLPVRTKKLISDQTDVLEFKTTSLADNTIAPSFSAANLKGKSLDLRAYQDTILFIDVWASWCLPCIEQFPGMNTLLDKYDGRKIKFLMISVDENIELWKKAVIKHNLRPDQYYTSNGFNGEFAKKYFINSLPRYLILQNGRVVSANSLSPDNSHLKMTLDSLLN